MSPLNIALAVLDVALLVVLLSRHKRLSSRTRRLGLCALYLFAGYFFVQTYTAFSWWFGWLLIGLAAILAVAEFTPYADRFWGKRVEYPPA